MEVCLLNGAIHSTHTKLTANDASLPGELFDSIIFTSGLQFENAFLGVCDFFPVRKNKGTVSYRLPIDETARVATTVNEHPLSRRDLTALPDADKLLQRQRERNGVSKRVMTVMLGST
jgi:hypothetical protein